MSSCSSVPFQDEVIPIPEICSSDLFAVPIQLHFGFDQSPLMYFCVLQTCGTCWVTCTPGHVDPGGMAQAHLSTHLPLHLLTIIPCQDSGL